VKNAILPNETGYAEDANGGRMKLISRLFLIVVLSGFASAKAAVNGNAGGLVASGIWDESHEGVGLFCVHVTNVVEVARRSSEASCFLTEVQTSAGDSPDVRTNVLAVQSWDSHGLTAVTSIYTDKNGDPTTAQYPNAMKYILKLVIDFDAHSVIKYVETPAKNLAFRLK
jgi:hypothetical protein